MTTTWTGTTDFPADQTAVVQTVIRTVDDGGFSLTLSMDAPALERLCVWDGAKFSCENEAHDFVISAENVSLYPETQAYRVRVTFVTQVAGPTTAEWNITAGNATLEASSLTAA